MCGMTERLLCEVCGRIFIRASKMGRVPTKCKVCTARITAEMSRQRAKISRDKKAERSMKREKLCQICGVKIEKQGRRIYCLPCSQKVIADRHSKWRLNKLERIEKEVEAGIRRRMRQIASRQEEEEIRAERELLAKAREKEEWRRDLSRKAKKAAECFDEVIEKARQAGLTYGQYQAMLLRKTNMEKEKERMERANWYQGKR